NRCNETLIRRYQQEIIAPLQLLLDGAFTEAEKSHTPVSTILAETKRPEDALIAADRIALSDLIRQLTAIREKLGEVLSLGKLRDAAVQIVTRQKQLGEVLRRLEKFEVEKLGTPTLATLPELELKVGEKRTIKHALNWGTFSGDDYRVKFDPVTPGLTLPKEFKVPDDKDELQYDIVASATPGTYRYRVVPSVGPAIEMSIVVKK
ncbi:MAG: hypothetical protein ACRCZF_09250, partial [Gemmataceae bacterium]